MLNSGHEIFRGFFDELEAYCTLLVGANFALDDLEIGAYLAAKKRCLFNGGGALSF